MAINNLKGVANLLTPGDSGGASNNAIQDQKQSAASLKNFIRERASDGTKWNKIFPYKLRIGNNNTKGVGGDIFSKSPTSYLSSAMPKGLNLNKLGVGKASADNQIQEVVLPIAPQNISITTPAASNLTVTLRGIIEEHNGAPLRMIRITGTSGVNALKAMQYSGSTQNSILGDIFKNTISAFKAAKGSTIDNISDSTLFSGEAETINGTLPTGYLFFHQLVNFVDQYFYYKKQKVNKDMYLVFEMQKDDLFYKCSLKNFSFQKRPGTLEYDYTLDLVGWSYEQKTNKDLLQTVFGKESRIDKIAQVIKTIRKFRKGFAATKNIIKGLGQDADRIFSIGQEFNMACKDLISVAKSVLDFPGNIVKSFKSLVVESSSSLQDAMDELLKSNHPANLALKQSRILSDQTQKGPSPYSIAQSTVDVRINKVFEDPSSYPDFFDAITMDKLTVPQPLQDQIDAESDRILNLDAQYWIERRDELVNISNGIANMIGLGSPTYNRILGNEGIKSRTRTPRAQELEILKDLGDLIQAANSFIVQKRNSDLAIQNYVNFYVDQALANGIDMQRPVSKFAVPVPYGATLQSLAVQYLGDAGRWLEIAAVNGLRSPFIDEDGFTRTVKGATNGQIITVSNADNLYVNQPVLLSDSAHVPLNARIKKIEVVDNVTVYLTLDKDATGYGESTATTLRAYLPNTVNSNMLIYIPTDSQPTVLGQDFKFSPDINDQSVLAAISGSDILLTSEGDIAVMPSGDVRTAVGVANLIQAATLKLVTPIGSLVQHPTYGLGVLAGTPTSEFDVNTTFGYIEQAFGADDRFQSVLASKISKRGNTVTIDVALQMPNTDSILPLTINLRQ
jgi:hypothetical protein